MSVRTPAARGARDQNHAELAAWYESYMCMVLDLSTVGQGCADLLVRIPTRHGGILQLVEVKTEDGRLSAKQERFVRDWGASNVAVVRTRDDVHDHIEGVKGRFR